MHRAFGLLAVLLLVAVATPGLAKEQWKGPEGIYWVEFPWEADLLPLGAPDGIPERYFLPGFMTFHADGTVTDTNQDPDAMYHAYWRMVEDHTIVIKTLSVARDWRGGLPPEQSPYTSEVGEFLVVFSEDYKTFEGVITWSKIWLCPPSPWGGPLNWNCPNPMTTELPPEYEEQGFTFSGWRFPEP